MIYALDQNTKDMIEHGIRSATRAFEEAGAYETVPQRLLVHAGFHLLGTACMGSDPASSVVNPVSRAHSVPNLLILDGSVFTTAAALNPTSTIQALALRASRCPDPRPARHRGGGMSGLSIAIDLIMPGDGEFPPASALGLAERLSAHPHFGEATRLFEALLPEGLAAAQPEWLS